MKISVLLPYKENYSPQYPGAVSLFVNSINKLSIFKKDITVYGSTKLKENLSGNYINIELRKKILSSQSKEFVEKFLEIQNEKKPDIIEIHNRPNYIKKLVNLKSRLVLYFHNDPLSMIGSKYVNERKDLLSVCSKIIFNSEWSKKRYLQNMDNFYFKSKKLQVIHQSTNKAKVNINKKENIIVFVGKLNTAKGFDIFGEAVIKILNKYHNWKAIVIGDEQREKLIFNHKNLKNLGFQRHDKVLKTFNKSNIAVVCSRWDEPFGRTSLEAASRGCAVIISNRGGLPETITNGKILRNLNSSALYKEIENLIKNRGELKFLQKQSIKNFYLTDEFISKKIDNYRSEIKQNYSLMSKKKLSDKLKILHVTNFNERHNGRLFYNTGKRINNGFIRLNHSVLEFSDRDIVSYYRNFNDFDGSKRLNKKLIEVISNYVPDIIVFGHADLIKKETLRYIKKTYPNIRMAQWFLDRMDGKWANNKKRFQDKIEHMDASFCTTDPNSLNLNKKYEVFFLPNPVDKSFEILDNYKKNHFNNDVFFAMSHGVHRGVLKKGKLDARELFIDKLIKITPNIRFDLYGMNNIQPIWADNYLLAISQSKIGLNLSQGAPAKYYSSDRFSQLIGNGLLVMIDEKTRLGNFFEKDEIVLYKNIKDLSNKITYYSNNNVLRSRIAKKGKLKYMKYFNSNIIAQYIIEKTFKIKSKNFYLWEKK
tara:strand:- start:764 stop:2881 length:2118 start_codon:yes stop_codon:yes gene_type:complete